ncbi:tRNA 2-selenouridine(34) synthase MnmH [Sporomusa acidovorans]|uniref:tRNA 2-selenouridine synthase n=1 Tax=Sporomusa acidovorans (strain ATCC 49682 / DSM 3132 / Mol) TaxID=1123286 RepID=A0ABZ3J2N3_SPOA4|nr:tRNA 2-selenouridine(34) synthase MnmH [Sporomusa acidovorans]OZC20134.1 tRNA 2-selenouridine synthase [Sporomusa acidovorans DSM 3132]SDD44147.1 tRNA 2-selenouridine synthase [Sporomusa acidovorans]
MVIFIVNIIRVEDAVELDKTVFIDVRSPVEYDGGHIPGAVNIPLFSNDERAQVGTLYKQVSVEDAKQMGLSFASTKLPAMIEQIRRLYKEKQNIVVYCWRGGMRSKAVVSVLEMMGVPSLQLLNGYKAYRQYVLDRLKQYEVKPTIIVLCGSTGTGKTMIIRQLAKRNFSAIDLEHLANHRGSVFGQIGLGKSATAQNFDAMLLQELDRLNNQPYIVVECESKRIGNVYLPECFYKAMKQGKRLLLSTNMEIRIDRLIEEYLDVYQDQDNDEAIISSINSLRKRLGNKKTDRLLKDFNSGQIRTVVKDLLIEYYDPMYGYEKSDLANYELLISADEVNQATETIIQYLQQLGR